jgi:hypothetical protein
MQMKRRIETQNYAGVEVKLYTYIRTGTHATLTETYVDIFRPLGSRIPIGARFTAPVETDPGAHPYSFKRGQTGAFITHPV